jgi:hypothetical protein
MAVAELRAPCVFADALLHLAILSGAQAAASRGKGCRAASAAAAAMGMMANNFDTLSALGRALSLSAFMYLLMGPWCKSLLQIQIDM